MATKITAAEIRRARTGKPKAIALIQLTIYNKTMYVIDFSARIPSTHILKNFLETLCDLFNTHIMATSFIGVCACEREGE